MSGTFDDQWLCERLLLPESDDTADAILSLYKDKTVVASPSPLESLYTVVPDSRAATSGDASIERSLQEQFGLTLNELASYHEEQLLGRVRTFWSLNHSWALGPWAQQLLPPRKTRPLVLHFDAHDDLAAPKIGLTSRNGVFHAPVGGSLLDLADASTVEEFVLRGFIGIGSFIAPLLHSIPALDIVHIATESPAAIVEYDLALERRSETTFTGRLMERPCVRLASPSQGAAFTYTRTSDVRLALEKAAGRDVILDIDLDYFCNAFDNRHPVRRVFAVTEATSDDIARRMNALHHLLKANRIVPVIATVALSPGFFPSDLWHGSLARLREVVVDL